MAEPWYQRLEVIIAMSTVGFIFVVCLLLIIVRIIWMRRQKRYSYGITEEEEELNLLNKQNELQQQSQISESDLLKARMFLRGTDFTLTKPVHNMGRDYKKHMLIRRPSGTYYIYTIMEGKEPTPIISTENEKYIFLSLLKKLDHPYIMKTENVDYSVAEQQITVSNPLDSFERKYNGTKTKNITNEQLITFVNQIIMGLASLRMIGIMFKNLSARNVLIDSEGEFSVARITDIEDVFLRIPPSYETRSYANRANQDSVALLQMMKTLPQVPEIDRLIEKIENQDVPIEELLLYVGGTTLNPIPKMDKKTSTFISKLKMTASERRLQKRQSVAIMSRASSSSLLISSKPQQTSSAASSYVNTNNQQISGSMPTISSPPPPPPPAPAPVAAAAPRPAAPAGRGDLLEQIRKGTKLTFKG
ncbi:serine/threonine-protein kinase [Acrasis kona]|uniref:Serine/threonine-protein kinase n=1 Tax=Acrasis kona TaxID=1008807 RepID=A0AAW2YUT7_9EUKA